MSKAEKALWTIIQYGTTIALWVIILLAMFEIQELKLHQLAIALIAVAYCENKLCRR